ncbi:unnamed protein product [Lasius platythorax]|uniref:Uncharacterized protein n=1 Tax=Lasius platythorax TaxID=488582 RepID=A0AAV2NKZ0_9HYME
MAKRGPNEAELDALNEQMKSLRKKLKKFTRAAAKEIIEPTAVDTVDEACVDNKENDAADTGDIVDLTEEDSAGESEGKSVFSASGDASDTDKEIRIEEVKKDEVKQDKETEIAPSLSSEMRERLCLRAEPEKSVDVVLHPVLVEE